MEVSSWEAPCSSRSARFWSTSSSTMSLSRCRSDFLPGSDPGELAKHAAVLEPDFPGSGARPTGARCTVLRDPHRRPHPPDRQLHRRRPRPAGAAGVEPAPRNRLPRPAEADGHRSDRGRGGRSARISTWITWAGIPDGPTAASCRPPQRSLPVRPKGAEPLARAAGGRHHPAIPPLHGEAVPAQH
jgi:hypothetical protein